MYKLRDAITREYSTSMLEWILKQWRLRGHRQVGNGVVCIQQDHIRIYFILDKEMGIPAGWLYLRRRRGWAAWEVYQVWVWKHHRGKGLAERLYRAAINTDRLLLASGNLHTQYSEAMWRSFIRRNLFNIWAHDFKNLDNRALVSVDPETDELECDLPIYLPTTSYSRSDVRLVATRRSQS